MSLPKSVRSFAPLLSALLIGLVFSVAVEVSAHKANGASGFPLDDPWIHLQFAKNLHDYGSFSYYKDEMVTSGSTSPLYTFILAAGFFFTGNEYLLSYTLGIFFFLLGGAYLFLLARSDTGGNTVVATGATVMMLLEPRLVWAALSGMETTMFIALLLAASYYYRTRKTVSLGIATGLLLWARPEAVIFIGVLFVDAVYHAMVVRHSDAKGRPTPRTLRSMAWLKKPALVLLLFAGAYAAFNLLLSGSLLPNTYSAKLKFYAASRPEFPGQVFQYLVHRHMNVVAVLAGVGIMSLVVQLLRRKPAKFLMFFLWPLLMFLAYWKNLPFLFQEGRYMMPVLPFVVLLAVGGLESMLEGGKGIVSLLARRRVALGLRVVMLALVATQFAFASWEAKTNYAEFCKYISDRQVRTAHWLHNHLPADAVVGTHDIGAIAFYSGHRVVDMVGLVSPEMIDNIWRLDKLQEFLISSHVTHLVVLRNWFEIVNQDPIFQTDELYPEIMEAFEFNPAVTHFSPQDVGKMTADATFYLSVGNAQRAGPILRQAMKRDPASSRVHFLMGRALIMAGRYDQAEEELRTALRLQPTLQDVPMALAEIALRKNQPDEAIVQLENLVREHPRYAAAYRALAEVYRTYKNDTTVANGNQRTYDQLTAAPHE